MQQAVELERGSRLTEQRRDHQRAVEQGKRDAAAHGGQGFGRCFGFGFGGFFFGVIGGFAGDFDPGLRKTEGAAAFDGAERLVFAADVGEIADIDLRAVGVGVQRHGDRAVGRGQQQRFGGAQLVHGVGDAQIAGRAQRFVPHAGLDREDAAAPDGRRGKDDRAVRNLGAAERVRDGQGRVLRREDVFDGFARAALHGGGDRAGRARKQRQRRGREQQAVRRLCGVVLFIERGRIGNLAFAAVRGAVLHGGRAVCKGDERGRAAAVKVDRLGAAERREGVGQRRERQSAGIARAAAVGDEQQVAAVGSDAERGAGLAGLLVLLVDRAVLESALPEDDVAAAERGNRVFKPAVAGQAHRDGLADRQSGIVRGRRKGGRHGQHGRPLRDRAVFGGLAHLGDFGGHLAAERERAVEREDVFGRGKTGERRGLAVVAGEQVDAVDAGVFVDVADREGRRIGLDRDGLADLAEDHAAVLIKADRIAAVRGGQQPPVRDQNAHRHAGVQAEKVGVDGGGERFALDGRRILQGGELLAAVQARAEVDGGNPRAGGRGSGDGERRLHHLAGGAVLVARERCRRAERRFREVCDAAERAERVRVDRRGRFCGGVGLGRRRGSGIGSGCSRGGGFGRGDGFGCGGQQQRQGERERRQRRDEFFICMRHADSFFAVSRTSCIWIVPL